MSFSTLAPLYVPLEFAVAGELLQRCRTSFLGEAVGCRHALILGEGPGRFLMELLRIAPGIEVTCIEQSPAMIRQAVRRMHRKGLNPARVDFQPMDALSWKPSGRTYDLVVTHFFLDCFRPDELQALIVNLDAGVREGGRWLIGDFCIPPRGWRRVRARGIHALMYAFFRPTTGLHAERCTAPDDALIAAGFRLAGRHQFNFGLLHSDVWVKTKPCRPRSLDIPTE